MMNSIVLFFRFIKNNFGKFVLGIFLTLIFLFLLFPFSDLNDLISSQISALTKGSTFLQFDNMHINPVTATITLDQVSVETTMMPSTLSATEISFTPSIPAIITGRPGGTITALGLLKGEIKASFSPTGTSSTAKTGESKTEGATPVEKFNFDIAAQNLSLKEVKDLMSSSLPLKGQVNFAMQGIADFAMAEQPEGELTLTIQKFELPTSSVSLGNFGALNVPEIKLGQVELKGKLANGKFTIENGKLGTPKDDLYADVKGDMGITISNMGGQMIPMFGAYNISLDMKITAAMKSRASFFITLLDGFAGTYKRDEAGGAVQYKFRMQGAALGLQPQFSPLQ